MKTESLSVSLHLSRWEKKRFVADSSALMETDREIYLQPQIRQCSDGMKMSNLEKFFMY